MTANALPVRDREPAGQRFREMAGNVGWGILTWVVGIAFFLPVLWMLLTAFKPESAAETWPPKFATDSNTLMPDLSIATPVISPHAPMPTATEDMSRTPWRNSGWSSRAWARS